MLNPLLLWFLPLALLPLALHLLMRYRVRTVELPTFRFLMSTYVQQRRRIKLLEYLTLVLRTLFVLLLIAALTRPVLSDFDWFGQTAGGRDVAIIIDASGSMAERTGATSSFERAKMAATTLLSQLKAADHVSVVEGAASARIVASGYRGEHVDALVSAIDQVRLTAGASDLAGAVASVLTGKQRGLRTVYVLTDGRNDAWAQTDQHHVLREANGLELVVLDIGAAAVANVSVAGVSGELNRPMLGLPMRLTAVVTNHANESREVAVSLVVDDVQVRQVHHTLEPGERVAQPFHWTPSKPGLVRGRFEITSDAMPLDDTWLFALNVPSRVNVLLVTGPEPSEELGRASLYLQAALASRGMDGMGLADSAASEALRITRMEHAALNETALEQADVVMLSDVPMDDRLGAMLDRYIQEGGGVFILPGEHVDPQAYHTMLLYRGVAAGAPRPLLLEAATGDPNDETRFLPISSVDVTHPVLRVFAEEEAGYFSTVRVHRRFPIAVRANDEAEAEKAAGARSLLTLPDRSAALAELVIGRGAVLVAGFAATPAWSNLPLRSEFVPLLLRGVAHLRRASAVEAPTVLTANQPAAVLLRHVAPNVTLRVTDPMERTQEVATHGGDGLITGVATDTAQKGYYTFRVETVGRNVTGEAIEVVTAVNIDAGESHGLRVDESELSQRLAPVALTYLRGSPDDPTLSATLTTPRELWRSMIWIMFALFGLEFLIATLNPGGKSEVGQAKHGERRRPISRLLRVMGMAEERGET